MSAKATIQTLTGEVEALETEILRSSIELNRAIGHFYTVRRLLEEGRGEDALALLKTLTPHGADGRVDG